VGVAPFRALGGQLRIQRQVAPRALQRRAGAVDGEHARRAAGQRLQAEAAGVAEAVEHAAPGGELARQQAVLALVEVEAGLVSAADIDLQPDAVLLDDHRALGLAAVQGARSRLQALQPAYVRIRALEDARAAARL